MKHPIRTSIQLQELLRLLRQGRGLTQAQLGSYLGVDRRRIAQIESNPGVTSFNQLSAMITVLGGRLLIESIPNGNSPAQVESTASGGVNVTINRRFENRYAVGGCKADRR